MTDHDTAALLFSHKEKTVFAHFIRVLSVIALIAGAVMLFSGVVKRDNAPDVRELRHEPVFYGGAMQHAVNRNEVRQDEWRRRQALDSAYMSMGVGILLTVFGLIFLIITSVKIKRARSSIYIFRRYITGLSSGGVEYRLPFDQISSVDVFKNGNAITLNAISRTYRVWVFSPKIAAHIQSLITAQKEQGDYKSETVKCACGSEIAKTAKFCSQCGNPPRESLSNTCSCGYIFEQGERFCQECGSPSPA